MRGRQGRGWGVDFQILRCPQVTGITNVTGVSPLLPFSYSWASSLAFPGDGDHVAAALNLEIFDFCYVEVDKELDGEIELIGEDEANVLYGVHALVRYELIN